MPIPPDPSASAGRTLRLSAILIELREEASPIVAESAAAQPAGASAGPAAEGESGDATTARPADESDRRRRRRPRVESNITIGEILDRTRQAGFGCIAALLALVAIPFMGLSTPFGLAIAFLGVQMIAGRTHPWLPARIRRHHVSTSTLEWLGQRLARWTGGLERVVRPRVTFATAGPLWVACGVGILLQGLGLALPLPIPGSNWVFIVPIILYGIGLLEADGLLILICHAITLVEVALGVWLWERVVEGLSGAYHWFGRLFG